MRFLLSAHCEFSFLVLLLVLCIPHAPCVAEKRILRETIVRLPLFTYFCNRHKKRGIRVKMLGCLTFGAIF